VSIVQRRFAKLYIALGHSFVQPELLEEALTHASASTGVNGAAAVANYERMEFLGDRVLNLVVAQHLLKRYPDEKVGQLLVPSFDSMFVSTDSGPGVRLGIERRWINDRGHKLGGQIEYSQRLEEYGVHYRIPKPGKQNSMYTFAMGYRRWLCQTAVVLLAVSHAVNAALISVFTDLTSAQSGTLLALTVPALVVPMGFTRDGLPLSLQIAARPYCEETAYRTGRAFELATKWHARHPDLEQTLARHLRGAAQEA